MSIEDGLKSKDVVKIKAARGTAKGQVTSYVTKLRNVLVVKDNKYPLDEINKNMVQELYQKLSKSYDNFQNLHYRYLFYRYEEENYDLEADEGTFCVDEKENHHSDNIENKVVIVTPLTFFLIASKISNPSI